MTPEDLQVTSQIQFSSGTGWRESGVAAAARAVRVSAKAVGQAAAPRGELSLLPGRIRTGALARSTLLWLSFAPMRLARPGPTALARRKACP
jgi:hypothetical protein